METKTSNFEITKIDPEMHLLPGVGSVDYIFIIDQQRLIININGFEVYSATGDEALAMRNLSMLTNIDGIDEQLLRKIAQRGLGIDFYNLLQHTNKREVVENRQILMWWLKKHTKCSLAVIGEMLGGFNHATVLHSIKIVNNLIQTNVAFREKIKLFLTAIHPITTDLI